MTVVAEGIKDERAREKRQHLGHLDALRGIAVLGVIFIHVGALVPTHLSVLTGSGQRGVQLFFVVSAFTLMLSGDNRKKEQHATLAFFLRRFFRLAPLYYIAIFACQTLSSEIHFGWWPTLLSVLFLHNFSRHAFWAGTFGSWSLGDEAAFYLCVPLLYRYVRSLRSSILLFVVVALVSVAASRVLGHYDPVFGQYWYFHSFVAESPVFLMGVMAYFLWKELLQSLHGKPVAQPLSALFLLLGAALYRLSLPLTDPLLLVSSVMCVMLLIATSLYPWKLLVNRVTIFLGKISYSIYLTHFFLTVVLIPWLRSRYAWLNPTPHRALLDFPLTYMAILIGACAISTLTWLYIEEPGIRLGRRVIRYIQGRSLPPGKDGSLLVPVRAVAGTGNSPDAQF